MAPVTLRAVTRSQGSVAELKDGTISPPGYALAFEEVPVLVQAFRRMVRSLEFDVCEMAITTYICAKSFGKPFTALPVFLVRDFHHKAVVRAAESDVAGPADLEGREVGVSRGYTVTTGVWARAILQEEYGLNLSRVTWVPTGDEHVAEYRPPANVHPSAPGQDLAGLVTAGSVAAGVGITADGPGLVPLIPDPAEAGLRALAERGLYPINHTLVVKDELLAAHPGLAAELFTAYAQAKNRYVERLSSGAITDPTPADLLYQRVMETTGADPLPYGIEPNRAMLEQLIQHAVTQRILPAPVPVEGLFAGATRHMTATV
jgi:ABC-type nitrate/sulfonate/bicarbonate transport system substrate-binding protein